MDAQARGEQDPAKDTEFKRDEQTGKVFPVRQEQFLDQLMAWVSGVYLIGALVGLSWLLFDFWVRDFTIIKWLGYDATSLDEPLFRLFAYAYIGGALGGSLTGIRSLLLWHSERGAFGRRFIWKSLSLPFQGAVLSLLVYVLLRTGLGALSGDITLEDSSTAMLSALGIGGLIGYGSHKVFIWLDAQVNRVFRVEFSAVVPNVLGRTKAEAAALLGNEALSLGAVDEEVSAETAGTVIRQEPAPGVTTDRPIAVAVVLAKAEPSGSPGDNGHAPEPSEALPEPLTPGTTSGLP